ncbi:hypothetical protein [Vibrio owensii]|uniref:hypothetical protein n=1 Tax=Vibrio harveyi group TaxID=717610 RepID=UPI003CC5F28E
MSKKLILNVSKSEFESRVVAALEKAMQSPLKKKKQQVVNAAMVQLLHGGNNAGQNEHNLDQFWGEFESTPLNETWIGVENYNHENSYQDDSSTVTGSSEDEVKRKLYTNVLDDLADTVSMSVHIPDLMKVVFDSDTDFGIRFLDESEITIDDMREEDVVQLLKDASGESLATLEAVFHYIVSLSSIKGTHEFSALDLSEPVEPAKKSIDLTIHTIKITNKAEGEDEGIDNVDVESTLSAEAHDKRLIEIFRSHSDESASFGKDDLIQHSVTQEVMKEQQVDDDELEALDYDQIIDWLCDNGRPNLLTDLVPDMNYGLIEIDVMYTQETIEG